MDLNHKEFIVTCFVLPVVLIRYEDVSRTRLEEHAQTNDADSSLQAFDERLYNVRSKRCMFEL